MTDSLDPQPSAPPAFEIVAAALAAKPLTTEEELRATFDFNKAAVLATFQQCYGDDAERWVQRWRMFYMAVAEFFGYQHGSEWGVTHLLFDAR